MKCKRYSLHEIATIKYGKDHKKVMVDSGTIPIYGTGGQMGYASISLYDKPSVLIGRKGTIGKVKYVEQPFWTIDTLFYTMIDTRIVLPEYLYYLMSLIDLNMYNEGTTIPSLRVETLNRLEFDIPSIEEQVKVLSCLRPINEKIKVNEKINNNLEQQVQTLFKSWFVDCEPFNGKQPNDWTLGTIDDLAIDVVCGKTPSTKKEEYYGGYIPFITIPDMHNCVYALNTARSLSTLGAESQSKKTLPVNSVCVSCIGTAGLVTLVPVPSQTNQQINSIIPKNNVSPYYVYLLMKTMPEIINKLGQSGSTIVNLNKAQFGKIEVIIPSTKIMLEFTELVKPIFELILLNQKENNILGNLRESLLPKLMSGEIDIYNINL